METEATMRTITNNNNDDERRRQQHEKHDTFFGFSYNIFRSFYEEEIIKKYKQQSTGERTKVDMTSAVKGSGKEPSLQSPSLSL